LAETFLSAIKGNYQSIQVNLILKYLFNWFIFL
jgi:hypothetical protein